MLESLDVVERNRAGTDSYDEGRKHVTSGREDRRAMIISVSNHHRPQPLRSHPSVPHLRCLTTLRSPAAHLRLLGRRTFRSEGLALLAVTQLDEGSGRVGRVLVVPPPPLVIIKICLYVILSFGHIRFRLSIIKQESCLELESRSHRYSSV